MPDESTPAGFTVRPIRTIDPVDTTEFRMRLIDWRRLYRKIRLIPDHSSFYSNLASVMAGVAGSAALSLFPLYQASQAVEPWVKPAFWVTLGASLIMTIVFYAVSRDKDRDAQATCDEVVVDMRAIHEISFPGQDIEPAKDPGSKLVVILGRIFWGVFLGFLYLTVFAAMDLYGMRTWFTVFAIILAVADFIVFIGWIDAITTEIDEKKAAKNQQSKR